MKKELYVESGIDIYQLQIARHRRSQAGNNVSAYSFSIL
jgi:hypothetical protein